MNLYTQFNYFVFCSTQEITVEKSDLDSIEEVYDYFDSTLKRDPYDNCDLLFWSKPKGALFKQNVETCTEVLIAPGFTWWYPKNPKCKFSS